jgi:choline kinase
MKAVILAAGMGTRLESVTGGAPKCMVEVGGIPLIDRMISRLHEAGIRELIVVTGHRHQEVEDHVRALEHPLARSAHFVFNDRYSDWGNFYSLLVAEEAIAGDSFIKLDGDVLMDDKLLPLLLEANGPAALAVDCREGLGDEEMKVRVEGGRIVALNKSISPQSALGEFVGVDRVDAELCPAVFAKLRELIERGETHDYYERAYELLIQDGQEWHVADVSQCRWTEIDNAEDLAVANQMVAAEN